MGNFSSTSFISNNLIDDIFKIHFNRKVVLLGKNSKNENESVSFFNERFQASFVQEKHFLNVYRVYDHSKKKWNNMKLLQILNKEETKESIKNDIEKFYVMSSNENFVRIEEVLFNEGIYSKNQIQLIILEETLDFMTLKDFLFILIDELKHKMDVVNNKIKIGSL